MIVTRVFDELQAAKKRFVVLQGGTRSGKTHSLCQHFIMKLINETGKIHYFGRKTMPSLTGTMYEQYFNILIELNLYLLGIHNKTDKTFKFNGNIVKFFSMDDERRKRGIDCHYAWMNEANEFEFDEFKQINQRTKQQFYCDFNPSEEFWGTEYLLKERYEDCNYIHSTYLDNPFLPEEQIKEIEAYKGKDEVFWQVYGLGLLSKIKSGAEFYFAFQRTKHVNEAAIYKEGLPLHISYDFNVVPYITLIVSQVEKVNETYEVRIIDEFCLSNPFNTTEALTQQFLKQYETLINTLYIYGDATGKNASTLGKKNNYDIIKAVLQYQINNQSMRVPFANPNLIKRRQFVNNVLNEVYNIKVMINPKCENTIKDFENVKEDADGGKLKIRVMNKETRQSYEKYGHTSDAFDYFITQIFKGYFTNTKTLYNNGKQSIKN